MKISAVDRAGDSDRLARTVELYRDLTVALRDRITALQAGGNADGKKTADNVREHERALLTVLDIEASLGKRRKAWNDGTDLELDLAAARAEIAARLARWLDAE